MKNQSGDKEVTKKAKEHYKKDEIITCNGCGKEEGSEKFKQCSQCKLVRYCGSECAKKDWKKGGHNIV